MRYGEASFPVWCFACEGFVKEIPVHGKRWFWRSCDCPPQIRQRWSVYEPMSLALHEAVT